MAKMYDSGQQDDAAHRGDEPQGLQKSYHMNLADQMDKQANGHPWPAFMCTRVGAAIAVVVVLIAIVFIVAIFGPAAMSR